MTPLSFTFKLSVPNDADAVAIVGELAKHAAEYAQLDGAVAIAFSDRARSAAAKAMKAAGTSTQAVFAATDGALTLTIGGESISQPLRTS